ncbi:hypothetical protein ABTZ93_36240 [Streptomyces sp. NPDC097941]|uniref:hypothetical protein n=1 Tax=Streptomyces sp. NPDC097941 TaxID=3155685 RepID=UPI0033224C9C
MEARAVLRAAGDRHALEAARKAFAAGKATPLKELAEQAEADGRSADAARLYRDAIAVFERRRRQREAGVTLIDFEMGGRSLREYLDPAVLPMAFRQTWALHQLVALLDGTQGATAGDGGLREVAMAGNAWALEQLLRRLRERGHTKWPGRTRGRCGPRLTAPCTTSRFRMPYARCCWSVQRPPG